MDFVYIDDVARANLLAADDRLERRASSTSPAASRRACCELARLLIEVMGSDVTVEFGPERSVNKVPRRLADTTLAHERLGFDAEVDLEEGLRRLVDWWRAERASGTAPAALAAKYMSEMGEIPITRPHLTGEEGAAVAEAIASGWVSQGPRVREFEEAFAARVGAAAAVATTSCTTALALALHVSGVGPGDEVIVPSLSFIATANAVWHCGAQPVFADIDPRTYNLDAAAAEQAITARTKAIMPVHQVGLPADMDAFLELARAPRHRDRRGRRLRDRRQLQGAADRLARFAGLLLAAPAQGHHHRRGRHDRRAGSRRRRAAAAAARRTGWTSPTSPATRATDVVIESYPERGFNFRMTDMQAALGLCQLQELDWILERRRQLAERYTEALAGNPAPRGAIRPAVRAAHLAVLLRAPASRLPDRAHRADAAPAARRHRDPPRRDGDPRGGRLRRPSRPHRPGRDRLPRSPAHTEAATRETLMLPLFPDLSEEQQDYVIERLAASVLACAA